MRQGHCRSKGFDQGSKRFGGLTHNLLISIPALIITQKNQFIIH